MRELTVRIKFTTPCLGSVKKFIKHDKSGNSWPVYYMPRTNGLEGDIRFEESWWRSGLRYAAEILCRHQKAVEKVHFDVAVDGKTKERVSDFFKRYLQDENKQRFIRHEAFFPGDIIGVSCVVPSEISDQDFWKLMDYVGRFRGISPFKPVDYGRFKVEGIRECKNLQRRECDPDRPGEGSDQGANQTQADVHPPTPSGDAGREAESQQSHRVHRG